MELSSLINSSCGNEEHTISVAECAQFGKKVFLMFPLDTRGPGLLTHDHSMADTGVPSIQHLSCCPHATVAGDFGSDCDFGSCSDCVLVEYAWMGYNPFF